MPEIHTHTKRIPEDIREYLNYEPNTGSLVWRVYRSGGAKAGDEAGYRGETGVKISFRKEYYLAHRIAWFLFYGEQPPEMIDHKDRNPYNNSVDNLRECTNRENQFNTVSHQDASSTHKGVHRTKEGNWMARIQVGGKREHLGTYPTEGEAAAVYRARAEEVQGEFFYG